MDAGETRRSIRREYIRRIGDGIGEPERAVLLKEIDDAFAEVVVVDPVTCAQRAVSAAAEQFPPETRSHIGGVGERDMGREVVLLDGQ